MEELAETFYRLLGTPRDASSAAKLLWHMPGDNHAQGIAKKLRKIADELDKIEELPPF